MRFGRHITTPLILAILLGGCAAQPGGPGGSMGGPMGGPAGDPDGRSGPPDDGPSQIGPIMASGGHLLADLQTQLDGLRLQLKLKPEQEAAWQNYQEKVGALMADQLRPATTRSGSKPTDALHQIDRKVDVVRNRLAAMEDIADAARRFYSELDPQQQAIADRALAATIPTLYSGIGDDGQAGRRGPPGAQGRRQPPG